MRPYRRSRVSPDGGPLHVYSTEETLEMVRRLCRATRESLSIDQDGGWRGEGQQVLRWHPVEGGQRLQLGATTHVTPFGVDHTPGAVGWRVESDGIAVVFSGDTRFSPNLVEAARGARLLIHEALCVDREKEIAMRRAHATSADAGRSAALAGVEQLIMTHIEYGRNALRPFHLDPQPLIDDARRYFDGPVSVASDLHQITVGAASRSHGGR